MNFIESKIKGLYLIEAFDSRDNRGGFTKIFNAEEFKKHGLNINFEELFYTTSNKGVIRAMHFNIPPVVQAKLVHCVKGRILDVVLDLRKNSPTYMQIVEFDLCGDKKQSIYVPVGCAHGYKCLEDDTRVIYYSSCGFSKECDSGIKYDSFGYDWKINKPIISDRDKQLVELKDFKNPF